MDLFPAGDPISDLIRAQIAVLEQFGAETAFGRRPPGVEVSFEVLWRPEEEEARGRLDGYREVRSYGVPRFRRWPKSCGRFTCAGRKGVEPNGFLAREDRSRAIAMVWYAVRTQLDSGE
jgi:hypothetical protein